MRLLVVHHQKQRKRVIAFFMMVDEEIAHFKVIRAVCSADFGLVLEHLG